MHYCRAGGFEAQRGFVIRYSIVRSGEERVAAVLVERRDLNVPRAEQLVRRVEGVLSLPVMLVAPDEALWTGARVHADFEAEPYLYALLEARDIEWAELGLAFDAEAA